MNPLPILAIALAIVITGVLVLRLHAFLTLIVAALAVAALTPAATVERYELTREGVRLDRVSPDGAMAWATVRRGQISPGVSYDVYRLQRGARRPRRIGVAGLVDPARRPGLPAAAAAPQSAGQVALDVSSTEAGVTLEPGDWVTTPAAGRAAARTAGETVGTRVGAGFGRTALDIGILIAMASILGACLMAARGAERIVVSTRRALGPSRTPLAFLGSGFLLGIPMFAEAVFYLLLPLAKAMWMETRRNYVLFVLVIVAGATMTHSLVPPTPGPLFVADALGIPLALMISQGAIVAACAALGGYAYALWADRRWGDTIHPVVAESPAPIGPPGTGGPALPPFFLSVLPILLPVILISADSALASFPPGVPAWVSRAIHVLGDKNVALTLSAGCALALLAWYAPVTDSSVPPDKSGGYTPPAQTPPVASPEDPPAASPEKWSMAPAPPAGHESEIRSRGTRPAGSAASPDKSGGYTPPAQTPPAASPEDPPAASPEKWSMAPAPPAGRESEIRSRGTRPAGSAASPDKAGGYTPPAQTPPAASPENPPAASPEKWSMAPALPAGHESEIRSRGTRPAGSAASPDKSGGAIPQARASRGDAIRKAVRAGVVEAGEIILVIAAGGALGAVLRQAGLAELASATVPSQKLLLLPMAWGVTALVRTAQGSATVAMITGVGIVGPIALAGQLPYHPVYIATAIGAGSKIGMWMNDSGFWAISRMSGMTEAQTLRTASVMVFIEGCVGLAATMVLAAMWPLV